MTTIEKQQRLEVATAECLRYARQTLYRLGLPHSTEDARALLERAAVKYTAPKGVVLKTRLEEFA